MLETIFKHIDANKDYLIQLQRDLVSIPALGPRNGGDGEKEKADWLKKHMAQLGLENIQEIKAPDDAVPCGYRPTLVATIPGKDTTRTLWIISHTDIVPPGDLSLWDTDPYELHVDGDTIYGRGVEDNHQGLVSSMLLAKALIEENITPAINLGLMFVADEETGSEYGLGYISDNHMELFGKDDLFLIPDFGEPRGEMVEVAEKSMFWLKVTVQGKQCHASTPEQGINSLVAASDFILKTRRLYDIYDKTNDLFNPAYSTFEATKKDANVENINTMPGRDVFYLDCRILADYELDEVLETIYGFGREVEEKWNVSVNVETVMREQAAPQTKPDSAICSLMMASIREVYGNEPKPVGVGGGTVAAFLRRKGFSAVVWATLDHMAHQPNESSTIPHTLGDAKVMATALMKG